MNRKTIRRQLPSPLLAALFLLVWELLARRMNAAYILPSPAQILHHIYELREPLLLIHLPATMAIVTALLPLSLLLGIFLAILMDQSKTVEQVLCLLLVASQTIPTTVFTSLFVLWLGYGIWSKVLATMLTTFSPIAVTLSDGFRATPPEMTELMQTLGAIRWRLFWKLELPTMLPFFFTAIRMTVPLSVIGATIGEWLSAQTGLDYFSRHIMTQLDGTGVFTPIVFLGIVTILPTALARQIETRALRFRNRQDSDREEARGRGS